MDANTGANSNPNKRKLTAREILDQIREEAERDKLEAEKTTLKRDSKNLELLPKRQPEPRAPSPNQNTIDNSFGDHQDSNHHPKEAWKEEVRRSTNQNIEGVILTRKEEDSREREGNDNSGHNGQIKDLNTRNPEGNPSQTYSQKSKEETIEKRSFDEKMLGLESLRQKLLENKRVNEGLKEEFEGLRSEIQDHTDRSKGKEGSTDNIHPQTHPHPQPQQKLPSDKVITLIVPEKRKAEEPYREPKEAHKEASEYLRNYRKSREKIEEAKEAKEAKEVPREKEAEVSFSEEKEAAKTESSIKKLEELIKQGTKEERKPLTQEKELEFNNSEAGAEELEMRSPVFKDQDSQKHLEEKGYDDWKEIQREEDQRLWKSDQEMLGHKGGQDKASPQNRGSLSNKNKRVGKDAHPIEKNIQIKVLEPVYKKETPKHDDLKEPQSSKEEPRNRNDTNPIKEVSRSQPNHKDPQPISSNQGPSREAFRKDPKYPLRDQVEYPQTTKNRREDPYSNAYFETPSARPYEDRSSSVTQRLLIDQMQRELQEKERLILWLESQRQESENQLLLLTRKVDELQEENEGLLRMNFELTREKSALRAQLDSFPGVLGQKSPKTTLYSTQASHFSAKGQPTDSLTSSFRNPQAKEDINIGLEQFRRRVGELLKVPHWASHEELLGEIGNLERLRGLGEEIGGNVIFQGGGLRGKLERIEAFFRLFGLDPMGDFLEKVNALFNEFVRWRTFLRVFLILAGLGGF